MSLTERTSSTLRRRDTFPVIRAAGKLIPVGDTTKTCLQEITPGTVTPPVVRKFVNSAQPPVGTVWVYHGKANDSDIASTLVHVKSTLATLDFVANVIDGKNVLFVKRQHRKLLLGVSNGGEVINPPKTTHQVKKEADEGHQLYIRSHGSYFVENADGQLLAAFVSLLLQESVWTDSTIAITIGEIVGLVFQRLITMLGEPSPDLCGGPVTH